MTTSVSPTRPERLLLDTHVFLWWAAGDLARISRAVRAAIEAAPTVYVSLATAWELSIKTGLAKLRLSVTFADAVDVNRFVVLPITLEHVDTVAELPVPPRHRDPFARLRIAQAMHERLTLVTHDRAFGDYRVPVLWA